MRKPVIPLILTSSLVLCLPLIGLSIDAWPHLQAFNGGLKCSAVVFSMVVTGFWIMWLRSYSDSRSYLRSDRTDRSDHVAHY